MATDRPTPEVEYMRMQARRRLAELEPKDKFGAWQAMTVAGRARAIDFAHGLDACESPEAVAEALAAAEEAEAPHAAERARHAIAAAKAELQRP